MLKWQDNLSQHNVTTLEELADDLRQIKSPGWSVIFSKNEVIVRPEDRDVGKFSITSVKARLSVSFFSRELNIWNKSAYFAFSSSLAQDIRAWMEAAVLDPKKHVGR